MPDQTVSAYIRELLANEDLARQITCHRLMPAAPAEYGQNRLPWPGAITSILQKRQICLYSHQTLATDHIRAGHSVVVATPTASGKSLIYNLPVLERFLHDPDSRALYLFPLKALAQDQMAALNNLCSCWPADARPEVSLYDGDSTDYQRRKIRKNPPACLLTNPEMLHLGILPYHENWTEFLASLNYVIVDEAHTYRGIFGSHMAQVFRRLNRITARYGSNPTYIFCTATLGNPQQLASSLMDADTAPALIVKSGAPQGPRHFLFVNPESAPSTCAIDLLKKALAKNLRVICYCRSRRITELISMWAAGESQELASQISSYRAGYLPAERREIEAKLANGELKAVITTSALELGIDIGGLDICILVGYPGTIMQTLQRGGRVGRKMQESAVFVISGEDALDQYFARNPEDFFSRSPEKAVINPDNEIILARHLECAASESPLTIGEKWLEKPSAVQALKNLQAARLVLPSANGLEWVAVNKLPQRQIDLRGCGSSYVIEDENQQVIGVLDGFRAWKEAHPGAVYLHRGESFVIDDLDSGRMRIQARRAHVDWFTRTRGRKSTDILLEQDRKFIGNCAVFRGRLRVSEFISGYEKRASQGQRLLTVTPLKAPPHVFDTDGLWLVIPDPVRMKLEEQFIHFMGSIHALEHAAIGLLPLEIMADRNDFGGISIPLHHQLGLPAVFIYDAIPGGAGLSQTAYESCLELLQATLDAIKNCACADGCPSCIHSPKCGSGNRPLSKQGAVMLLEELLTPGPDGEQVYNSLKISPAPDRLLPETPNPQIGHIQPRAKAPVISEAAESYFERLETGIKNPVAVKEAAPPSNYVVFDVETRLGAKEVGGWRNARAMGVSVACLYDSGQDRFFSYEQQELGEFFSRLARASLVIGFNNWQFDYEVLAPLAEIMGPSGRFNLKKLPTLDLLRRLSDSTRIRISLDNLAQATLNAGKSANGLQALKWWREGRLADIAAYCQQDVELTRDLYLFGLREKYLLYRNKAGQIVKAAVNFEPEPA